MPIPDWRLAYDELFAAVQRATSDLPDFDLTVELITHRFTPGSKDVLMAWYPSTKLEMDESTRAKKHTKFGSTKYVYRTETMRELRTFFEDGIARHLPRARILCWT